MKRSVFRILTAAVLILLLIPCAWAQNDTESADQAWYLDRAQTLRDELHEMISFEGFAEYFSSSEEIAAQIDAWKIGMESTPLRVTAHDMPSAELMLGMLGGMGTIPEMPAPLIKRLSRGLGSTLITNFNGQQGVVFLAAASTATLTEGYVMPEGFTPCIVIYEYEDFCVCVNFAESGEETIQATAQICTDMLTQALGAMP